jgi:hypothetical protein
MAVLSVVTGLSGNVLAQQLAFSQNPDPGVVGSQVTITATLTPAQDGVTWTVKAPDDRDQWADVSASQKLATDAYKAVRNAKANKNQNQNKIQQPKAKQKQAGTNHAVQGYTPLWSSVADYDLEFTAKDANGAVIKIEKYTVKAQPGTYNATRDPQHVASPEPDYERYEVNCPGFGINGHSPQAEVSMRYRATSVQNGDQTFVVDSNTVNPGATGKPNTIQFDPNTPAGDLIDVDADETTGLDIFASGHFFLQIDEVPQTGRVSTIKSFRLILR